MTINELIERLKEFNPDAEVRVGDWFSFDYTDVRVGESGNVVSICYGIKGLNDIIDELNDSIYDLDKALDDLDDDGIDTYDAENALDSIRLSIDDLADLEY